ncbi:MAG: alpha-L-fucosidase [Verrucomicrobia bacterium]|nr:alpha-L-fucosidase [Verrucomicrobiota bacterium]
MLRFNSLVVYCLVATALAVAAQPPAPYGPLPSPRQLAWHEMEFYGFVHFTVNTFTDREWGYGDESPAIFNPTDFDADQIARTARDAGMRGLILTAKHHDGFCLWPSRYTEHSVKHAPWRGGRGDVVREMAEACRRAGIKFGVYLSPWDRNHPDYGRPAYLEYYRHQLRELLTNYGPLFTVWFDGANGGDGFYGGANERRNIDNRTYYDWPGTWAIVRELQPMASMFSDAGPDFRWVGNEQGIAGETCWATLDMTKPNRYPGGGSAGLNSGERPGTQWLPAECDVSIRPGWFYHAGEDEAVKSPAQLLDIYFKSVGRGACLNLNLPPDRRGRIHENDVRALRGFRRLLDETFAVNLARGARVTASHERPGGGFTAARAVDGDRASYWTTGDEVTTPELVIDLGRETVVSVIDLREHLPLGQRVEAFTVETWRGGGWVEFGSGTSIGNRRLLRGPRTLTTRVRLRITRAAAAPAIAEFGLYAEPLRLDPPAIVRNRQGMVALHASTAAADVRYTTDGSEPTAAAAVYAAPFPLPRGGVVKARVIAGGEGGVGEVAVRRFGFTKGRWKIQTSVADASRKNPARQMIDEAPATVWRAAAPGPLEVTLDLGEAASVGSLEYQPPADGIGAVDRCEVRVSLDGRNWSTVARGEFGNLQANPVAQTLTLSGSPQARFVRLVVLHTLADAPAAIAELGLAGR